MADVPHGEPSPYKHPLGRPPPAYEMMTVDTHRTWMPLLWGQSEGSRECHGFVNPCGSTPRVRTGMGTGWGLVTLTQPAPVVRAPSGHSGFCT